MSEKSWELSKKDFSKLNLDKDVDKWLKSEEGIIQLACAWQTGLYLLKKTSESFGAKDKEYRSFKSGGKIVGLRFYNNAIVDEGSDGEWAPSIKKILFHVEILISIDFSIKDDWASISNQDKDYLGKIIWEQIELIPEIKKDKNITYELVNYSIKEGNLSIENSGLREFNWVFNGNYENEVHSEITYRTASLKLIKSQDFASITGKSYSEFSKILYSDRVSVKEGAETSSSYPSPYRFRGYISNKIESQLAKFLLAEGFIVVLEPDMVLPQIENYRRPDLLIINKGRTLALEIDSRFHLTEQKWQRDRLLDQSMLCNGIPLLRVWWDEAEKHPELVMTKILQIFESLGGSRMIYD